MAPGRDRRVKIGQCLGIGEPRRLRDESLDKPKHAVGPVDNAIEELMGIGAALAGFFYRSVLEGEVEAPPVTGRVQA